MLSIEHELLSWQLLLLIFVLLLVLRRAYRAHHSKRQQLGIPAFGVPPGPLGPWIAALRFIRNSAAVIEDGVQKHGPEGRSFKISTPARWIVVVTSDAVLKELADADERFLSMQAAADERNSIRYVLNKCIHDKPYHVAIIKKNLTQQLSKVLSEAIADFREIFDGNLLITNEWSQISVHNLLVKCISTTINRILVGQKLAHDQDYLESVLELSKTISRAGPLIDLTPRLLKSIFAYYLMPKQGPFNIYLAKLSPLFEERRKTMRKLKEDCADKPNDAIQWILEATPPETPMHELCAYILYIQFSAIHTSSVSITNCLHDLATHPDFQTHIKNEIEEVFREHGFWTKQALGRMKKLDSSLKESQRLHPVTTATMMRKAQQPYTLADGTNLAKGQWVVVPAWAFNRSAQRYHNPNEFDAFRFSDMRKELGTKTRCQKSALEERYLSFGAGRHACPGRFFAATELKALLAYIIYNYDFKLTIDEKGARPKNRFSGFSCLPNFDTELMFKLRDDAGSSFFNKKVA